MAHIFISYAHVDGDFVALLKLEIEKAGLQVWVDAERLRAGEDWRQGIDEAIKGATALVAVMSPEAFASQYVTYEWAFALGMGVKVIPLMLRATALHPRMEVLQYLNFTSRDERPWESLIQHLQQIEQAQIPSMVIVPRDAPPAVKQAVAALDSPDPEARKVAIDSLAQMKHPIALEALAGAVQHPTRSVRMDAAFRLSDITRSKDVRALPGLLDALYDQTSSTAIRAAELLGKIHDPEAIPDLLECLRRDDGRLRRTAAKALSRIGTESIPGLITALEHRDQRVREVAAWALGEIQDPNTLPGLMTALRDIDVGVYRAAYDGLLKLDVAAVPDVIEALKDEVWSVRQAAAKLLGEIGDVGALDGLFNALTDSYSDVRKAAAEALGKIGDSQAVPALLRVLSDDDNSDVRCTAAEVLGLIGDERGLAGLIAILENDNSSAPIDLGQPPRFGEGLNEFNRWNDKYLCKVAAEALRRIGTPEAVTAVEQWQAAQGKS
jgi:HEAT repeat protein